MPPYEKPSDLPLPPSSGNSNGGGGDYGAIDKQSSRGSRNSNSGIYGSIHESIQSSVREYMEEQPQHSILGILLIMLGSFSFSCMFLFVKLMEGTANSFTLVFYRSLVQIVLSLGPILKNGEHPMGPPSARPWLLVRGGAGAGAVLAFFYAIQNLPLPDAVTLQFTTPPFAAAFAVCLAGEKWMRLDMIGSVVCIGGVVLIAHPTWLFGEPQGVAAEEEVPMNAMAILVAIAGAAMAGMAYMSVRLIGDGTSANVMVLYYAVISIPMVMLGSKALLDDWAVWGSGYFAPWDYFVFLLTGFAGYGGQYFTNLGLQRETAATGTLATCTQIVWTYIFELWFLHEAINGWSVLGTSLILGFMVFVGYIKLTQADPTMHETVAGESEEAALLYASERNISERNVGPAFANIPPPIPAPNAGGNNNTMEEP